MHQSLNEGNIDAITTIAEPDVRLERTLMDQIWMKQYRKIEAFEKENGHCDISFHYEDNALVRWMAQQRVLQHNGKLRKDRKKVLHDIGFVWIKVEDDDEMWRTVSYSNQATTTACLADSHIVEGDVDSFCATTVPLTQCDDSISPAMLQCNDDEHILADDDTEHTVPRHKTSDVSSERLARIEGNEIAIDTKDPSAETMQYGHGEVFMHAGDDTENNAPRQSSSDISFEHLAHIEGNEKAFKTGGLSTEKMECDNDDGNYEYVPMIDVSEHDEPRHYSSNLPSKRLAHHERNEMAFEAEVCSAELLQFDDHGDSHEHVLAIDVAEHDAQFEKSDSVQSERSVHEESNLTSTGTASISVAMGGESNNAHNVPPEHLPHNKENEKASRAAFIPNAKEVETAKQASTQARPFIPEIYQHVPRKRPRKGTPYSLSVYRNRS
jgi:hypothetical protein